MRNGSHAVRLSSVSLTIYGSTTMKKPLKLTTKCLCGHELGDHRNKRPHACMEPHATRVGHGCSCVAFQVRGDESWSGSLLDTSAAEHAERSAAGLALEGALRSIDATSLPSDGFEGIG